MKKLVALFLVIAIGSSQIRVAGRTVISGRTILSGTTAMLVTVVGTPTAMQAIFAYAAPSSGVCTVKVSESPSFATLVHDVDPALFTGADQDNRIGNANNGTSRVFIAGKRGSGLSVDGVTIYSLALQALTLYYVQVTCGSTIGTTTFTTSNIPVGSTFNEPPPVISTSLNQFGWLVPTLDGTRTQLINDPFTGALTSPVSLPPDQIGGTSGSAGTTIGDGAQSRPCNSTTVTDPITGLPGYLCNLSSRVGWNQLYLLIPSTGAVRLLGMIPIVGAIVSNDLRVYGRIGAQIFVTSATNANPVVITADGAHGLTTGDGVEFTAFTGNWDVLNGYRQVVTVIDGSRFSVPIDSTSFGAVTGSNPYFQDTRVTYQSYLDNFAPHVGGTAGQINLSAPILYSQNTTGELLHNFDATFDPHKYGCETTIAGTGGYSYFKCSRGEQNAYGWHGLFYGGDGRVPVPSSCMIGDTGCPRVVAGWNSYHSPSRAKWCGTHQTSPVPNEAIQAINWHSINDLADFKIGTAAVYTTVTTGSAGGANVIHIAGSPTSQATLGDPESTQTLEAGDLLLINGGNYAVASRSGLDVTLTTNLSFPTSTGDKVLPTCNIPAGTDADWAITYWEALLDVHGTDLTNTYVVPDITFPGGGHYDTGKLGRVSEDSAGYLISYAVGSSIMQSLNGPVTLVNSSAAWNGIQVPGYGVLTNKHPSYQQLTTDPYYGDHLVFTGGVPGSGTGRYFSADTGVTPVCGSLWQYHSDPSFPLHRKLVPTQAINGGTGLLDISSTATGNVIGCTSADYNKFCVAYKANECRTSSVAGDIFVNVSGFDYPFCSNDQNPYIRDVCINDIQAYGGTVMQWYFGTSNADAQSKSRMLTPGGVGPRNVLDYPVAKTIPDASYTLYTVGFANYRPVYGEVDVWKTKMTPLPAPDGIDRTGYIPTPITVAPGSQNNVVVKFWYQETIGADGNAHCMLRSEDCYATAATVPAGANPFAYPSDGAGGVLAGVTGLACASGCTVAVPAISQHTLYTQVVYRDAANNVISTGPTGVKSIP